MCQYLFAAFSLKRGPDEGVTWSQLELMRRWEAEHHARRAAGDGAPRAGQQPADRDRRGAVLRAPELPAGRAPLSDPHPVQARAAHAGTRCGASWRLRDAAPARRRASRRCLAACRASRAARFADDRRSSTTRCSTLFRAARLARAAGSARRGAQFATTEVIPVPTARRLARRRRRSTTSTSSPVTDLASAAGGHRSDRRGGRGRADAGAGTSHFAQRSSTIAEELAAAQRDGSRTSTRHGLCSTTPRGHGSTHPATRAVAALFDLAYGTTLLHAAALLRPRRDETPRRARRAAARRRSSR